MNPNSALGEDARSYRPTATALLVAVAAVTLLLLDPSVPAERVRQMPWSDAKEPCRRVATLVEGWGASHGLDRPMRRARDAFAAALTPPEPPHPLLPPRPPLLLRAVEQALALAVKIRDEAPSRPVFTGERPLRALVLGDSMMQDLQLFLKPAMEQHPAMECRVDYKVSSGLSRPDFFNWPARATKLLDNRPYDIVVVWLGPNDWQPMVSGKQPRREGSQAWLELYLQRSTNFVRLMAKRCRRVYWLGLPRMRAPGFDQQMRIVTRLHEKACQATDGATYLPVDLLNDANGNYASYLTIDGKRRLVRAGDGYHTAPAGARLVSELVIKRVKADWFAPAEPQPAGNVPGG